MTSPWAGRLRSSQSPSSRSTPSPIPRRARATADVQSWVASIQRQSADNTDLYSTGDRDEDQSSQSQRSSTTDSTSTSTSTMREDEDEDLSQRETATSMNFHRRVFLYFICAPLAVLLGFSVIPPILLRLAIGLYGPVPVPVMTPLVNAGAHLCNLRLRTHGMSSSFVQKHEEDPDFPPTALKYLREDAHAKVGLCNRVRELWQHHWQVERRFDEGPCYKPGLGRFAPHWAERKFYHPDAERDKHGILVDMGYEDYDDANDDDSYQPQVPISTTCAKQLEQYVIPGLNVADMRQLNHACRHWTDRTRDLAEAQVQRIHIAARDSQYDVVEVFGELWERIGDQRRGRRRPSTPSSSQAAQLGTAAATNQAVSSIVQSLNLGTYHWLWDGPLVYYQELRSVDDEHNKRREGKTSKDKQATPYRRKNRHASQKTERHWTRYRLGSLGHVQQSVLNSTWADLLWMEAEPALAKSLKRIQQACPLANSSGNWQYVCEWALQAKGATRPVRTLEITDDEEALGAAHWKSVKAVNEGLGQDIENFEALRCGFALALELFGEKKWDQEILPYDAPAGTMIYAESDLGRLGMAAPGKYIAFRDTRLGRLLRINKIAEMSKDGGAQGWQECSNKTMWQHFQLAADRLDGQGLGESHGKGVAALPHPPLLWRILWTWLRALASVRRLLAEHCFVCYEVWSLSSWLWPSLDKAIHILPGDLATLELQAKKMFTDLLNCGWST